MAIRRCDATDRDRIHRAMPVLAAPTALQRAHRSESNLCLGLHPWANCVAQDGLRWAFFLRLQEDLRAR
jgi:hypothetical protein